MDGAKRATRLQTRLLALTLALVGGTSFAQPAVWERTFGPYAAVVTALHRLPSGVVLAGTMNGKLFRSDDAGHTWQEIQADFNQDEISAIVSIGQSVFVAVEGNGVYESSDGLATWRLLNRQGLPTTAVTAMTIYNDTLYVGTTGGVARIEATPEGRRVWNRLLTGLQNVNVRDLAVASSQLFAATNSGVFRFDAAANTWLPSNQGLTVGGEVVPIRRLFANGSVLFAGSSTSGVFRSDDGGATWQLVREGMRTYNILSFASLGETLFAGVAEEGVYRSDDKGGRWTPLFDGCPNAYPYALLAVEGSLLVGTFGSGVYRLDPGASRWTPSSEGMSNASVFALFPTNEGLLAGTTGGVFFSTDGRHWTPQNEGLQSVNVRSFGPALGGIGVGFYRGGYAISRDGGRTWTPGDPAFARLTVRTLATEGTRSFMGVAGQGILVSDAGSPWAAVEASASFPFVVALIPINDRLYAATDGRGVFESLDGGKTWTPKNDGLVVLSVYSVVLHRGKLFCGTFGGGVYVVDDSGKWNARNGSLTDLQVRSLLSAGETLYATTARGGVFRSDDEGASWQPMNEGLNDLNVRSICLWRGFLYAATGRDGVYRMPLLSPAGNSP